MPMHDWGHGAPASPPKLKADGDIPEEELEPARRRSPWHSEEWCLPCMDRGEHNPMIVVYDQKTRAYVEPRGQVCHAREDWGLCGGMAKEVVAGIPVCDLHYEHLAKWMGETRAERDRVRAESEERITLMRMEIREEDARQRIRLAREYSEAKRAGDPLDGVVYYIRRLSDGAVKIGMTSKFKGRMSALATEHGPIQVLLVLDGWRKEEKAAHEKFRSYRIGRSEWFCPVRSLMEWIYRERKNGHFTSRLGPEPPARLLPVEEVRALARSAPRRRDLERDEWKGFIWPPREPGADAA